QYREHGRERRGNGDLEARRILSRTSRRRIVEAPPSVGGGSAGTTHRTISKSLYGPARARPLFDHLLVGRLAMESVVEVPVVLTATAQRCAPDERTHAARNVVGLTDRRRRLIDLDNGRVLSAPEADSAPAPGQLVRELLHAAQLLREELEGRLLAANGNLHSWSILSALEAHDGVSQRSLSDACRMDAPTITRVLDRLEAQGFVKRRRDEGDRRIVRVTLTGNGRLQHLHLARAAQALEHELGGALSPCSGSALRGSLTAMATTRQDHPAGGPRQ
ncbi:MAG: transcriptional regulator, partial [Acidimicrobiia bacterium]|nr:transcriptional regulator [Acidimicrobiia bacterium]